MCILSMELWTSLLFCEILNSKCRILCPPHIAAAALLPRAYTTGWCQTNSSE